MLSDPVSDFLEGLMSLYKELPCLWDTTHGDYNDHARKCIAYLVLKNKMLEMDKNASIDSTRRFLLSVLSSMQDTYLDSLTNPGGVEDPLWYKNFVLFFMKPHVFHVTNADTYAHQQEVNPNTVVDSTPEPAVANPTIPSLSAAAIPAPIPAIVTTAAGGIIAQVDASCLPHFAANLIPGNGLEGQRLILIDDLPTATRPAGSETCTQTEGDDSHMVFVVPTANAKISYENRGGAKEKRPEESGGRTTETAAPGRRSDEERIFGVVEKILRNERDELFLYGKHVGEMLRKMPRNVTTHCQKLIDAVLFLGETGELGENTKIVNADSNFQQHKKFDNIFL